MVNAEFSKGVWEPLTDSGLSLLEVRDVLPLPTDVCTEFAMLCDGF